MRTRQLDFRLTPDECAAEHTIPGFAADGLRVYESSQPGYVTFLLWSESSPSQPRGMRLNVDQVLELRSELQGWLDSQDG